MVKEVRELHQRRRSSWRDGKQTHVPVFLVTCDSIRDGTAVALTADDGERRVPRPSDTYPNRPDLVPIGIDAEPHQDSGVHFLVTVEYASEVFVKLANPLQRPAEINYGGADITEPYFIDKSKPEPK